MLFSEKLDLLMNITNTSNSSLARSISLDASFVSRLRRGIRTPAKNENYLMSMAAYFSRNCHADYQKDAIYKALNLQSKGLLADNKHLSELVYKWFGMDQDADNETIENFIENFAHFRFNKAKPNLAIDNTYIEEEHILTNEEILYGVEGKRTAVIHFLLRTLKNKESQTLLLYSDEDMGWLTGNREFTLKWASLLSKVIANGNRIKIIHTVNRNLDEMLTAIKEWLPIYMTGSIEPYYYPKARDGVYRRTLFIAPDNVAISSSSIGDKTSNAANFYYTNINTIKALVEEFNNYLTLCRPLMKIFTPANRTDYLSTLTEFETEDSHSILRTDGFSSITMPTSVTESILRPLNHEAKDQLLAYHEMRIHNFEKNLEKYKFTEIITIPDIETIRKGEMKIGFSDMLGENQLYYTPTEFIAHVQNVLRLLEKYDNYHVYIESNSKASDYLLYAKEDVGIIVAKKSLPSISFAINENNMTLAFWDYMYSMRKKISKGKGEIASVVKELSTFLEVL